MVLAMPTKRFSVPGVMTGPKNSLISASIRQISNATARSVMRPLQHDHRSTLISDRSSGRPGALVVRSRFCNLRRRQQVAMRGRHQNRPPGVKERTESAESANQDHGYHG
jgi:hypothetical protein